MFDIEYKGGNTVVIATKKSTVVADPKLSLVGLKDMKVADVIELATEERFAVAVRDEARLSIGGPGEYEVGDFIIRGVSATCHIDTEADERRATIYRLVVGEVSIGVLGNIADKLDEDQLEGLGLVDILIIPVGGGGYTLDATSAATLVRQIEPKVVIPVHYADSALKYEVPQDSLEVFTKELGAPVEQLSGKYKVKAASTLPQTLTVIALARG